MDRVNQLLNDIAPEGRRRLVRTVGKRCGDRSVTNKYHFDAIVLHTEQAYSKEAFQLLQMRNALATWQRKRMPDGEYTIYEYDNCYTVKRDA